MSEQKTPEPNIDLQKRTEEFKKRFGEMRADLKVDIAAFPVFVPNERGTFEISVHMQIVDVSNEPVASPFVQKAK